MRVLLVTPNPVDNSLGRTYCLYLLLEHLGWDWSLLSLDGSTVWEPLRDTAFGQACRAVDLEARGGAQLLADPVRDSDVVIAVKPVPTTLGAVYDIATSLGRPLIVDVDDPDVEVRTVWRPMRERIPRRILQPAYRERLRMGRLAKTLPTLVSNPVLQELYGGILVPHVRPIADEGDYSRTRAPIVRFVGSPKGHKGLPELRAAVASLADRGFTLEVTAPRPDDAAPHERWLGYTTIAQGQQLVATADIVAIPSLNRGYTPAQLPAKLIDAMMLGRPVVASAIRPIEWALGGTGITVAPGDVPALAAGLLELREPETRRRYGQMARIRALDEFSVEAVAPRFAEFVTNTSHVASASSTSVAFPPAETGSAPS